MKCINFSNFNSVITPKDFNSMLHSNVIIRNKNRIFLSIYTLKLDPFQYNSRWGLTLLRDGGGHGSSHLHHPHAVEEPTSTLIHRALPFQLRDYIQRRHEPYLIIMTYNIYKPVFSVNTEQTRTRLSFKNTYMNQITQQLTRHYCTSGYGGSRRCGNLTRRVACGCGRSPKQWTRRTSVAAFNHIM